MSRTLEDVRNALKAAQGHRTVAAKSLGMSRQGLESWIDRYPELTSLVRNQCLRASYKQAATDPLGALVAYTYEQLRAGLMTHNEAAEYVSQQLGKHISSGAWRHRVARWAERHGLIPVGQRDSGDLNRPKKCRKCGEIKQRSEFYSRSKTTPSKRDSLCKQCRNQTVLAYIKQRYQTDPEYRSKMLERSRQYWKRRSHDGSTAPT